MEWALLTTCSDSEDDTAPEVDEGLGSACTVKNPGKSAKELQLDSSTASGISDENKVVCKHWLQGVCKKGDQCLLLHEYDPPKMSVCYFYSRMGNCSIKGCQFLHADPDPDPVKPDKGEVGSSGQDLNIVVSSSEEEDEEVMLDPVVHTNPSIQKSDEGDVGSSAQDFNSVVLGSEEEEEAVLDPVVHTNPSIQKSGGISGENKVCKHWLRGVCKKGGQCLLLHEYDPPKMSVCYFYSRMGNCSNKGCQFLHVDLDPEIKDCLVKPEIVARQDLEGSAAQKKKRKLTEDRQSQVSEVAIENQIASISEDCVGSSTDPSCSQLPQTQAGEKPLSGRESKKIYECIDCSRTFQKLYLLSDHLRSDHIMVENFKCTTCNLHFPDAVVASNHWSKSHNFCELYPCTECNLILKSEEALSQHQSGFHGKMSCRCSQCFALISRLKRHHRRVHSTKNTIID